MQSSECDDIGADAHQFDGEFRCDAVAARRVFAVDHEVGVPHVARGEVRAGNVEGVAGRVQLQHLIVVGIEL